MIVSISYFWVVKLFQRERSTVPNTQNAMRKANEKNHLHTTTDWETICFPVRSVPVEQVIKNPYQMIPSDRQRMIIGSLPRTADKPGQEAIFAVQSAGYSLVPNATLRDAVTRVLGPEQPVHIRYNRLGEYAINILLPDETTIGPNDIIQRQLTFTNSYTGKSQFTIQGKEMKQVRQQKIRIAFHRQICLNGMMGWADEFYSLDEYLNWLLTGKQSDQVRVKGLEWVTEEEETLSNFQHLFTHRDIDLDDFQAFLAAFLRDFTSYARRCESPTLNVFQSLQNCSIINREEAAQVVRKAGIPKTLVTAALERMEHEERLLDSLPNAWLLYNGVNHALFNGDTGLSMSARYQHDERAFHAISSRYLL